ncbi:TRAP transporter small permease subunit [Aquabacter spiritensis]|uniref:TRAP transporter small permease protein n=1 Tax=Aquabacter spiritensis TaxID=933073 RepID=A0A4R3LZL3_9HYPH|nr:TRAP transporter small permease subunit [Aquabacter spiritensis]TCT06204.1 TRAP-type mannitol/chloroaromatic compound transport system permease small subunit [Aquabacter spiritensis]
MIGDATGAPPSGVQRVSAILDAIVDRIGALSAWTCLALVLVMATNVLLRYGFSLGSVWAQELEWHLLVPICLLGAAYALRHGEHVRVDVLYSRYSPRGKALTELLSALVAAAVCVIIIKLSVPYVLQSYGMGEGSANPGGIDARYVLKAFIPLGFALVLLQSVSDALKAGGRLFSR